MKKNLIFSLGLLAAFALAFIFMACSDGTTPTNDPVDTPLTGTVEVQLNGTTVSQAKVAETVTAKVTGSNAASALRYQWQKKAAADTAFTNISGATSSTYKIGVSAETLIKVVITAPGFKGSKESGTVTVKPADALNLAGTVTITNDDDEEVTEADIGDELTAKFTPAQGVTVGASALQYKWQKSDSEDGTFDDITGATSKTYTLSADDVEGDEYIRVVVSATDFIGEIESEPVLVVDEHGSLPELYGLVTATVTGLITKESSGVPIRIGDTLTVEITSVLDDEGAPLVDLETMTFNYQWQRQPTGYLNPYADIGGKTDDTYVITAPPFARYDYIRVKVTAEGYRGSIESYGVSVSDVSYTITFDKGEGTALSVGTPASLERELTNILTLYNGVNYMWNYTAEHSNPELYFIGWYKQGDSTQTVLESLTVDGATTLVAKFGPGFTVTLNLDGGTYLDFDDIAVPSTHKVAPGGNFVLYYDDPTKDPKVFMGWFVTIDSVETKVNLASGIRVTSDITIVAKWADGYTVTIDLDGGELVDWQNNPLPLEYTVAPGNTFTLYDDPEKEDFLFAYWYKQGDPDQTPVDLSRGIRVDDHVTFVAKWGVAVTVTLNANGGEFSTVPPYNLTSLPVSLPAGTLKDPYGSDVPTPTLDNYTFLGWGLTSTGNLIPGVITVTETTLYALWAPRAIHGVYASATGAYWLMGNYTLTGVYFSNDGFRLITRADDLAVATIGAGTITVSGVTYTLVTEKKMPAYNAGVAGTWNKGDVTLRLENISEWYSSNNGSAFLRGVFSYDEDLCYVVEGETLYLLMRYSAYPGPWNEGEIIWSIPIVGGALQGWTKQ